MEKETARIKAMAAAVNDATAMSKGQIKEIATVGINLGLTGEQTENYTKAAIGLAKVTNGDASEGPYAHLSRPGWVTRPCYGGNCHS